MIFHCQAITNPERTNVGKTNNSSIMWSSLRDDHKRSKRITDSTDATDLFFHGFLSCCLGLCAPRRIDLYGFSLRLRQSSAEKHQWINNYLPNKISIDKNSYCCLVVLLSGCFVVWLFCCLGILLPGYLVKYSNN